MVTQRVAISVDEVVENIRRYNKEIDVQQRLAARIKQHPAWYAVQAGDNSWLFGPSKFVGYHGANAQDYLASYSRKDGRDTEPALSQWFEQVDKNSALGRQLWTSFVAFAQRFGKTPNANWRVSVPNSYAVGSREQMAGQQLGENRIVFDPGICGGRARIAGTRVRVSDIISMLADGAARKEILKDFPYLTDADISASLAYAAKSVDHVILIAA